MEILVAKQSHFDSIQELGKEISAQVHAIVRCRCQPNTCMRPVCKGCVQCLRSNQSSLSNDQLLTDFFCRLI